MGKYRSLIAKLHTLTIYSCLLSVMSNGVASPCPKVNCDCANLPIDSWRASCTLQEQNLIQQCIKNGGQPTDFCFLHGPAGFPLPLATNINSAPLIEQDKILKEKQRALRFYWSIHHDINYSISKIYNHEFIPAQNLLASIGVNLDQLFTMQHQITASLQTKEALAAWRGYAMDTYDESEKLYSVATELWDRRQFKENSRLDNVYRIFSIKALRLASKSFEMAALSFNNAGQHKNAAKAWQAASDASKSLMTYKEILEAPSKHISYYKKQTAARLLRASYHWQLHESGQSAAQALTTSEDFSNQRSTVKGLFE